MASNIKCPNCGTEFEPNESIRDEVQRELRIQMTNWQKKKETEFETQLLQEKNKFQKDLEEKLRKNISSDFETKLRMLEETNQDNEQKLKQARQQQIEFLRKEQELKNKEAELELSLQKRLQVERESLANEIRKLEEQRTIAMQTEFQLRIKDMEEKLEAQKKLAEEMQRRAEQGSSQLQGESQELLLEEMLQEHFPFDTVEEVGKGVEGADCILVVRNKQGAECGKIIFESKRTKGWSNIWVEKLKKDMRNKQADIAILVSQTFPRDMSCFGERDGVWIASFKEVIGLTVALRNAIISIADTKKSEENKGEKMQMLYNYLTGLEFRQQIEAIVEGFLSMKNSITRERIQMEKMWKEREKQLEKVLINTSGLYGSIKGIAGASVQDIPLLEASQEEDDVAH